MKFISPNLANPRIILSGDPSPTERFAAEELQKYLERISGIQLQVSTTRPAQDRDILVGGAAKQENTVSAKELSLLADDGFVVRVGKNRVYLAGGNDRGTLYSVYHFLELLGCWWFAPSFDSYEGNNEYIPDMKTIELERMKVVQQPLMKYRKKYVEEGITHNTENLISLIDWMAKNRLNIFVCPKDYQAMGTVKWDNWRETLIPS